MSTSMLVVILLLTFTSTCAAKTEREIAMETKLKQLNKPAVKSIKSEDGDIIDCIDIYKQPAFDHPLLQNHTIEMKPNKMKENPPSTKPSQTWHKNGSCPSGTIPILRTKKKDLINAGSIEDHGKKPWTPFETKIIKLNNSKKATLNFATNHSFAVQVATGESYVGAAAEINVWNPRVEMDDEYTTAQIWLTNGIVGDYNSIEAGWIVNPSLFGDRRTRLFIYWTRDGGKTTGCFNLKCPGFVQTSSEIAIGATIWPVSTYEGNQYTYGFYIFKNEKTGDWWLQLQGKTVGYWPDSLFTGLSKAAPIAQFGGDVYSPRTRTVPHTTTAMGSGEFAEYHLRRAAFIKKPRILDYSGALMYPPHSAFFSMQPSCYDADIHAEVRFTEPLFYFGGPGKNVNCK